MPGAALDVLPTVRDSNDGHPRDDPQSGPGTSESSASAPKDIKDGTSSVPDRPKSTKDASPLRSSFPTPENPAPSERAPRNIDDQTAKPKKTGEVPTDLPSPTGAPPMALAATSEAQPAPSPAPASPSQPAQTKIQSKSKPVNPSSAEIEAGAKIDSALQTSLSAKRAGEREKASPGVLQTSLSSKRPGERDKQSLVEPVKKVPPGHLRGGRGSIVVASTGRGAGPGRGIGPARGIGPGRGAALSSLKTRDSNGSSDMFAVAERLSYGLKAVLKAAGGRLPIQLVASKYNAFFGYQMKLEGYKLRALIESGKIEGIHFNEGATVVENEIVLSSHRPPHRKHQGSHSTDDVVAKMMKEGLQKNEEHHLMKDRSLKQLTRTFVNPGALRKGHSSSSTGDEAGGDWDGSAGKAGTKTRPYPSPKARSVAQDRDEEELYVRDQDGRAVDSRRRDRDLSTGVRRGYAEHRSGSPVYSRRGDSDWHRGSYVPGTEEKTGSKSNGSRAPARVPSYVRRDSNDRTGRGRYHRSRSRSVERQQGSEPTPMTDSVEGGRRARKPHYDDVEEEWSDGVARRYGYGPGGRGVSPTRERKGGSWRDVSDAEHGLSGHTRGSGRGHRTSHREARGGYDESVEHDADVTRTRGMQVTSSDSREGSPVSGYRKRSLVTGEAVSRGVQRGKSGSFHDELVPERGVQGIPSPPHKRQAATSRVIVNGSEADLAPGNGAYERSAEWDADPRRGGGHRPPVSTTSSAASLLDSLSTQKPAIPGERTVGTRLMIKGTHPAVPERRIHALVSEFGVVGKIEVLEGFVLVHMRSPEEANRAVAGLDSRIEPHVSGGTEPLLATVWSDQTYQLLMQRDSMRRYADAIRKASTWYEKNKNIGFQGPNPMPCRFFALGRGCIFGRNCIFAHGPVVANPSDVRSAPAVVGDGDPMEIPHPDSAPTHMMGAQSGHVSQAVESLREHSRQEGAEAIVQRTRQHGGVGGRGDSAMDQNFVEINGVPEKYGRRSDSGGGSGRGQAQHAAEHSDYGHSGSGAVGIEEKLSGHHDEVNRGSMRAKTEYSLDDIGDRGGSSWRVDRRRGGGHVSPDVEADPDGRSKTDYGVASSSFRARGYKDDGSSSRSYYDSQLERGGHHMRESPDAEGRPRDMRRSDRGRSLDKKYYDERVPVRGDGSRRGGSSRGDPYRDGSGREIPYDEDGSGPYAKGEYMDVKHARDGREGRSSRPDARGYYYEEDTEVGSKMHRSAISRDHSGPGGRMEKRSGAVYRGDDRGRRGASYGSNHREESYDEDQERVAYPARGRRRDHHGRHYRDMNDDYAPLRDGDDREYGRRRGARGSGRTVEGETSRDGLEMEGGWASGRDLDEVIEREDHVAPANHSSRGNSAGGPTFTFSAKVRDSEAPNPAQAAGPTFSIRMPDNLNRILGGPPLVDDNGLEQMEDRRAWVDRAEGSRRGRHKTRVR